MTLVVHDHAGDQGEDETNLAGQNFESNPVTQQEFGEYVASLHSCNGSTFILQYEVLLTKLNMKLKLVQFYICSHWRQEKRVKKLT